MLLRARWKFRRKKKKRGRQGFFFGARRPREEQEKARGEVLGRDAVQCVGLGRVPRSRAAMSASKGFYRTVCRYLPTLMEMYKLDELTTIRTLQHNIKQKFYENKTIKDPNVSQREGDWGRELGWRRSADRPSACALEVPFWTGPDRSSRKGGWESWSFPPRLPFPSFERERRSSPTHPFGSLGLTFTASRRHRCPPIRAEDQRHGPQRGRGAQAAAPHAQAEAPRGESCDPVRTSATTPPPRFPCSVGSRHHDAPQPLTFPFFSSFSSTDHKVRRDARPLRHQGTPKRIPGAVLRLKLRWQMGYRGPAGGAYA